MGADNLSLASTRSRSSSRARGGGSRASSIASATSSRRKKVTWADHPELTKGVDENRFIGALEGPELDHIKGTRHFLVEDGEDKKWPFLLRFKNVIFGVSLGLAAQAVMWKYLTHIDVMKPYKIPAFVNETFWIVALLVLLISFFIYSLKIIFWRGGVYREFLHPVRVNFFFAPFVVSLLLMLAIPQRFIIIPSNFNQSTTMSIAGNNSSIVYDNLPDPWNMDYTYMKVLFFVIMAPYFFLDLYLYGAWMYSRKRSLRSGNPTYQLAVIGNFFGANVASRVGEREVSLMLLAIGTVFYLLVFISIYQAISRDNVHHLTIPNLVDFDEEEEEEETAASGSESEKEESEEKKKTEEDVEVTAKKEDDGDGDGNMSDKHHSQLIAVPNQEHHHHHHNHHRNPHHGHHGHHGHHHHIEHDHHGDSHNRSHHHHHHHHGSRYHHRDHHNHSHHHHHHHRKSRCHGCNNDVDYYSETDTESSDENRHHHRHHHRHSSRHRRVRRRARDSHHKRRGSRSDVHSKVETTAETEEKEDDEKPRLSLERIKDDSEKALSALFNDGNVDLTADVFQSDDDDDQSANGILNQQALPERFLQTSSKDNHESGGSRIKQYIKSFSVDDCYLCERQYSLPPPLPPPLETDFCIDCEKNLKEDAATPAASPATSPKQRSPTKTYRPSSLAINQEVKIPTFRANLKPAVKPSPNLKRRPPPLMLRTQSCDARLLLSRSAALLSPVATPRSIATSQANSGVGDGTAIRVLLHSSPVFSRRAAAAAATTKISPLTPVLARRSRTMSTSSDALNAGTKTQTSTTNLATDRSGDEKDDKEKPEGVERHQSTLVLYPPHHDRTEGENDEDHDGKFPNLHPSMHPVLFVFVAPPAAAALALSQYYGRNGMGAEVSDLSKACFFIALFLFLSIIRHLMLFVKDTPYSLSYWAYTFPIATLATSAINYSNSLSDVLAAQWLAFGIVAIATILILIVAGLTIYQVVAGRGVFPNDDVVGVCINTLANGGGGGSSGGRSDTASVYSSVSGSELGNSCSDSDSTLMGEEGHKKDRQGNDALPSLKKRRRRKRRENSAASDPAPVPADTVIEMEPPFLQGNHGNIALKLALSETSL